MPLVYMYLQSLLISRLLPLFLIFFLASYLQKKPGHLYCRVTHNLDIACCIPMVSLNIFFYSWIVYKQMVIYRGSARFRFELFGIKCFIGGPAVTSIGSTLCLVFLFITLRLISWGVRHCQSDTSMIKLSNSLEPNDF